MRYQQRDNWCGPACIVNALRCFGKKLGQRHISKLAGTVADENLCNLCNEQEAGTCDKRMLAAIDALGYGYDVFESDSRDEAAAWLERAAETPLILCTYSWRHWTLIAGRCAGRFLMHDPDNSRENARENGCHALTLNTLLRHWRAGRKTAAGDPRFYGIAVSGPLPK